MAAKLLAPALGRVVKAAPRFAPRANSGGAMRQVGAPPALNVMRPPMGNRMPLLRGSGNPAAKEKTLVVSAQTQHNILKAEVARLMSEIPLRTITLGVVRSFENHVGQIMAAEERELNAFSFKGDRLAFFREASADAHRVQKIADILAVQHPEFYKEIEVGFMPRLLSHQAKLQVELTHPGIGLGVGGRGLAPGNLLQGAGKPGIMRHVLRR